VVGFPEGFSNPSLVISTKHQDQVAVPSSSTEKLGVSQVQRRVAYAIHGDSGILDEPAPHVQCKGVCMWGGGLAIQQIAPSRVQLEDRNAAC
jgi:hypothetical protein